MEMMSLLSTTGNLLSGGYENTSTPCKLCNVYIVCSFFSSYLIDKVTLNVCNRWRRERGEPDLLLSDIGAQGDSPPS
jgi:hypothetical protein